MLKKYFKNQKYWKLFVILQIVGFIGIFVTYIISFNWSPLDLLSNEFWGVRYSWVFAQNWVLVFCLFVPFTLAKGVEWMSED